MSTMPAAFANQPGPWLRMGNTPEAEKTSTISDCDWSSKSDVAELARKLFKHKDSVREAFKQKVFRNIEFVAGNQWHEWNPTKQAMVPNEKAEDWRALLVFNRILPALEMDESRLIERDHVWRCPVGPGDQSDRVVARLCDDVMEAYYKDVLNMPAKVRDAVRWARSTGMVYGRCFWDKSKGIPITTTIDQFMPPVTGAEPPEAIQAASQEAFGKFTELFGEQAAIEGQHEEPSGDPDVEIVPPLDVYHWPPPSEIISMDQAQVNMVAFRRTVGEIATRYGMTIDEVREIAQPPDEDDWQKDLAGAWASSMSTTATGTNHDERDRDTVYEFELTVPAGTGGWKNGRYAIVIGYAEEAIVLDDLPTPDHRLPLVQLQDIPIPGKFYGTCKVDQMISGQIEINTAFSQNADYRNTRINPMLFRMQGDTADEQGFDNAPARIQTISGPEMLPRVVEMPDIGNQYMRDIQIVVAQMNDLGGASGVDYGSAEQDNVKSGVAVNSLREQNNMRLRPFAGNLDRFVGDLGQLVLAYLQEHAADDRILHLVGNDQRSAVVMFNRDMIRPSTYGQPGQNPANVICESFRDLPTTLNDKMVLLNQLMSTKPPLLDPQKDRGRILRMLGFGDVEEAFDIEAGDEAKAVKENDDFRLGKAVDLPSKADNHMVHLEQHRIFARGDDYRQMMAQNPRLAMDLDEHMRLHEEGFIRDTIRPQYASKVADFKEWQDWKLRVDSIAPGMGDMMFPAPMSMMQQAAPTGEQDQEEPPPPTS